MAFFTIMFSKDNIPGVIGTLISLLFIGGCIFYIFTKKPDPPPKNQAKCTREIYFNHNTHRFDTAYSNMVLYRDSVVSFTDPEGKIWLAKDFVTKEDETDVDEDNDEFITDRIITVTSGDRFTLEIIDDTACGNKRKMDSLRGLDKN